MTSLEHRIPAVVPRRSSASHCTPKPLFAVLLLHGLAAGADELKPIVCQIVDVFGAVALVLQPTFRIKWHSIYHYWL